MDKKITTRGVTMVKITDNTYFDDIYKKKVHKTPVYKSTEKLCKDRRFNDPVHIYTLRNYLTV